MYCEELSGNHRTAAPHRSETSKIAERVVRRLKEGTSAVLLQSGSDDKWWLDSVECCCCLRYDQDFLADGKSQMNEDLVNPFWTCSVRGRNLEGDILIAETEELDKLDASGIYPRRLNAKEVLITQKDGQSVFPVADGSAKLSGRDYEFQEPTLRRESTVKRENLSGESHGDRLIHRHHFEPRSSTNVPREESFLFSKIYTFERDYLRCGRWIGEKPKHLRQKQIQLY